MRGPEGSVQLKPGLHQIGLGLRAHRSARPFRFLAGAWLGAVVAGNSMKELKALGGGFAKVFKGPRYNKKDYLDVIFLVSTLMKKLRTEGPVALEPHIEDPKSSSVFGQYPKLLKDSTLVHLITDTLRLVVISSGTLDPMAVEDVMDNSLKTHHHDDVRPADALQSLSDALPALGIVAAVLGVIKTMGSITEPPAVLGSMIGSALVGTFMGVFLAYGLVGPMANRLKEVVDEDGAFYKIIQSVLVAHLHGNAAQISVEIGRGNVPTPAQPSFGELEEALGAIPAEG